MRLSWTGVTQLVRNATDRLLSQKSINSLPHSTLLAQPSTSMFFQVELEGPRCPLSPAAFASRELPSARHRRRCRGSRMGVRRVHTHKNFLLSRSGGQDASPALPGQTFGRNHRPEGDLVSPHGLDIFKHTGLSLLDHLLEI